MLSALCLPQFSPDASAWIEGLRLAHVPDQAKLLGPHVTLVFPTAAVTESAFISHVSAVAAPVGRAAVCFRSALPYREPDLEVSYVFFVPDEGFGWLTRLHERLHSGPLRSELDSRRPYVPHITVGKLNSFAQARALSERLNSTPFEFSGRVNSVDLVRVESAHIERFHSVPLHDS